MRLRTQNNNLNIVKQLQFFLLLVFGLGSLNAQIQLIAKPSKTKVTVNERFSLNFYVQIQGNKQYTIDEFLELPEFKDFHTLGVSDTRSTQYNNGELVNKIGKQVFLMAEKEGNFTIGSATIVINNKTYQSKPFTLNVSQGKEILPKQQGKRIKGAFLMANLSNPKPFVNEGTILTVKLFARDYNILNRKTNFKLPKFDDFVIKRLDDDQLYNNFRQELVGGKVFISEEIAKFILFPKKAGNIAIEPFSIDIVLSNFYGSEKIELSSEKLSINSKALPRKNQPKNYNGAVGEFAFKTDVSQTKLKSNKSINLDVELIGSGNLNMVEIPPINIPEEIEVYQPKKRSSYKAKASGIQGKLAKEYILVPQYGGNFTIDPIEFSYFDPKEKTYKQIQTNAIDLQVEGKPAPKTNPIAKKEEPNSQQITQNQNQLKDGEIANNDSGLLEDLKNYTQATTASKPKKFWKKTWFWASASAGVLGIFALLFVALRKRTKNNNPQQQRPNKREKKQQLVQEIKTLKSFSNPIQLAQKQEEILTNLGLYLCELPFAEFTPSLVQHKMQQLYNAKLAQEYYNLLLACKAAQYAQKNSADLDIQNNSKKIKQLVQQLL